MSPYEIRMEKGFEYKEKSIRLEPGRKTALWTPDKKMFAFFSVDEYDMCIEICPDRGDIAIVDDYGSTTELIPSQGEKITRKSKWPFGVTTSEHVVVRTKDNAHIVDVRKIRSRKKLKPQ